MLDGVFQDEHGDFPAGSYIRNPPTTRHTPGSAPGCVIFVKLWQFDPADRTQLRLDTTTGETPGGPGVMIQPLFQDMRETVRIERWSPGLSVERPLPGGAELLVLDGGFTEANEAFAVHSWLRLPAGATLAASAGAQGCRLWLKAGHLGAGDRPAP